MKVPFEFQPSTLEFLLSLVNGLAYKCIHSIFLESGGKISDEDLAALEQEISKDFFTVRQLIQSNPNLKKTFGYLYDDSSATFYEFGISAVIRMAKVFEDKHKDAKTKGFIGIQAAYLREAQSMIKALDRETFSERKNIQAKFSGTVSKQLDEVMIMINEVFQCSIPARESLNYIKQIEQKVRPIEPKNIRIPPQEANFFANFRSEEMETVGTSLNLFVNNKKQHIEKTIIDLKEKMNDLNKNYNIPFLKSCSNLGESVLTPQFIAKLKSIRDVGEPGFQKLLADVAVSKQGIEANFQTIDKLLAQEVDKDKQTLSTVQNASYTTFLQAFADNIANVNNIKSNYRNQRGIEERLQQGVEKFRQQLPRLANSSIDPKELVKVAHLDEFISKNQENLQLLKKYSDGVEILINQHIQKEEDTLIKMLKEIDVDGLSGKCLMNEKTIDGIYTEINEQLGPLITSFEEKVTKVSVPLDKMKEVAMKLQTLNPQIIQNNPLNDTLMAVDFFSDLKTKLLEIANYYEMLNLELSRIKNILQDGAVARDVNREQQVSEAKSRQARYEDTKNNFYNNMNSYYNNFEKIAGQGLGFLSNQLFSGGKPANPTNPQPSNPFNPQAATNYPNMPNFPGYQQNQQGGYPGMNGQALPYPGQPGWNPNQNYGGYPTNHGQPYDPRRGY